METPTKAKSMSGIEFVRHLMKVKEQAQRDAVESYHNDPEVRAIVEKLKKVNGRQKTD